MITITLIIKMIIIIYIYIYCTNNIYMVPPRGLPFMSFPWSLRCFMIMFGCCCCCRRRRCLFVYTCFVWPLVKGGYHTYIIIFIYIYIYVFSFKAHIIEALGCGLHIFGESSNNMFLNHLLAHLKGRS